MTDYTKTTNFASKDALPSGNANKIVKGTEINTEFDNIATAVTTKANIANPAFTGVVSFPDGSASNPSITNTGDTNAGLFFSAADTLAFSAGGTAQVVFADGVISPVTDSDVDLGTNSLRFKDAYVDSVTVTGNGAITGDLDVDGTIEFDALSGTGSVAITDILDEDDMASNSATALVTQQSIKAYVIAQQDTVDSLSEVLALGNTTGDTDISVTDDTKVQFRDSAIYINSSADGQLDIVADTEIQIAATTVDINGAVALNGAVTGATNVTLSGELDAATGDFSGAVDIDGALDVAGTTNLDVVDIDGATQIDATVSVGVDDTGYDVKFFGATSGKSLLWDESADSLIVTGTTTMTGNSTVSGTLGVTGVLTGTSLDISGDIDVDGTTNLDVVDIDGAVDMSSTLAVGGVVTANAGVVVDTMTLDGSTLTSTGDFIVDAAADIIFDADGEDIRFKDGGVQSFVFTMGGGSTIATPRGNLTLDVAGDIILDADGGDVRLSDAGTQFGKLSNSGTDLVIESLVSDRDMVFRGNDSDGGGAFTALTLDMSAAGQANFNSHIKLTDDKQLFWGDGTVSIQGDAANEELSIGVNNVGALFADASGIVVNEGGTDRDFRVESDSNDHALFVNAADGVVHVNSSSTPSSSVAGFMFASDQLYTSAGNTTSTNTQVRFINGNGLVGSISTANSATAYNTSSDQRLKENIADADDAGSKIDSIQVRQFDWKTDGLHQDYGMVAQELQTVAPEAVSAPENPDEMMSVDYSKLVPMMLKEIQSLRARVADLES